MGVAFGVVEALSSEAASLGLLDPEEEGGKDTLVSETTNRIGLSQNVRLCALVFVFKITGVQKVNLPSCSSLGRFFDSSCSVGEGGVMLPAGGLQGGLTGTCCPTKKERRSSRPPIISEVTRKGCMFSHLKFKVR